MNDGRWLIYGANGYTGRLIAQEAAHHGMRPVLGGRRPAAVREVATEHGFEHETFLLDDPDELARRLEPYDAVLLAAGPFAHTSRPVVEACLQSGTHYFDITGELDIFEDVFARDERARERGVTLLPGVGFDVVPSDCLAARLAEALPGATQLELALSGLGGGPSPGTTKTMVEALPEGGAIRRGGRVERVPAAWRTREVPFHDKTRTAVSIPWGDVSTAYYSTGIGDIVVYMAMPERMIRASRLTRSLGPLLGLGAVQRGLKRLVDRRVEGPSEEERRSGRSELWGRVVDAEGRCLEGTATTPDGYTLTARTSVEAVRRVLEGGIRTGALTPSLAFGSDFLEGFAGCEVRLGTAQRAAV